MAITYVSKVGGSSSASGGSSSTITVGAGGVAQNDRIIVAALVGNGTATPSVPTDSGGNTYVLDKSAVVALDSAWVWSANASTALVNGNTIVVNLPSGNTEFIIIIEEYSGIATSGYTDGTNAGTGTSNNASSGNVTTGNANDLLFGAVAFFTGSTTVTWLNSFTHRDQTSLGTSPTADVLDVADNIVSATNTYVAAATLSGSPEWLAIFTTYQAAGSVAAVQPLYISRPVNVRWPIFKDLRPFYASIQQPVPPVLPWTAPVRDLRKVLQKRPFKSASQTTTQNLTQALNATLSFTGSLTKATSYHLTTATLSFTGALTKATSYHLTTAILSFTGALTKTTAYHLTTAILSFTGTQTRAMAKNLTTAVLSFIGTNPAKVTAKKLTTAILSFTGSQTRAVGYHLAGALSFTGTLTKATAKQLTTAVLSFTGAPPLIGHHFVQTLTTAVLGFTGALTRNTGKNLPAGLSFTGNGLSRAIAKKVTGSLSFVGSLPRAIQAKLTVANLNFAGSLARQLASSVTSVISEILTSRTGVLLLSVRNGVVNLTGRVVGTVLRSRDAKVDLTGRDPHNNIKTR